MIAVTAATLLNDISRLKLMKTLVDGGDTISAIASLNEAELQARLQENQEFTNTEVVPATLQPCRVVVVGETLAASMEAARDRLGQLDLVASFDNNTTFQAQLNRLKADTLVIEQQTLHVDTAIQINDWVNRLGAFRVIVIYRFAGREALKHLPAAKCIKLRAPVTIETLQQQCGYRGVAEPDKSAEVIDLSYITSGITPARLFDDETLARLAASSTSIKCECPRHLSELISSLAAFEQYSSECESRNVTDAELHNYLNETAARARYMIETALSKVIETDNIKF